MSSARKNSYPREFKLKVLEYYFKNGGEQKFGLKSKTAQHFCIDHKTVSRMLCNPDIVKKARRALSRKQPTPSCKTDKPNLRDLGEEVEAMEIDNTEVPTEELPSHKSGRNLTPEKHNVPPLPIGKAKVPATKCKQEKRQQSAEVSVIELPEDPDYSLLKQTIQSSASGAANIAKLLLTGTKEVKQIITNECELIFECKVCRNLFRSVVNFLAHKRVYCEEEYTNVKSIFHKDTGLEMTSQSNTVVVEPEPPPEDISPLNNKLKVDNIATQLANKKQKNGAYMQELSSSTNTGSSQYFEKLAEVNEARNDVSKDCSVKLQDIVGVTTAVYQTFVPPNEECPDQGMQDMLRELEEKKKDTAHLDEEGNIVMETRERIPLRTRSSSCLVENITTPEQEIVNCSTCGISFPTQKLLDSHISDVHGIERTVYTCPICNMAFLSIWGCVKHLIRIHKKKKHQRERLKHVICSRSYKKNFTTNEMSKHNHRSYPQEKKKSKEECSDKKEEESYPKDIYLPPEGISRIVPTNVEENVISQRKKTTFLSPNCHRCGQTFSSSAAMDSHSKFCLLTAFGTGIPAELPEKKIAIQIRKDYQKEAGNSQTQKSEQFSLECKPNSEVQSRIQEVCVLNRLYCVPCKRKYHSLTVLKRHAAQHLGWTRFACARCSFRSYDKYACTQHCAAAHGANDRNVTRMILEDECLGNFKYSLQGSPANNKEVEEMDSETTDSVVDFKFDVVKEEPVDETSVMEEESTNDKMETVDVNSSDHVLNGDCSNIESLEKVDTERCTSTKIDLEADLGTNGNYLKEFDGSDSVIERPQRLRKLVEQKDFVYETRRNSSSSNNRMDDDKQLCSSPIPVQLTNDGEQCLLRKRTHSPLPKEVSKRRTISPPSEENSVLYNGKENSTLTDSKHVEISQTTEKETKEYLDLCPVDRDCSPTQVATNESLPQQ